VNEILERF